MHSANASLATEEDEKLDRYPPTVRYLQKLGPDYLDLILDHSKWVLAEDSMIGLQVRLHRTLDLTLIIDFHCGRAGSGGSSVQPDCGIP